MAVPGLDPGIVPAIHAQTRDLMPKASRCIAAWIPGTRPGMTALGIALRSRQAGLRLFRRSRPPGHDAMDPEGDAEAAQQRQGGEGNSRPADRIAKALIAAFKPGPVVETVGPCVIFTGKVVGVSDFPEPDRRVRVFACGAAWLRPIAPVNFG